MKLASAPPAKKNIRASGDASLTALIFLIPAAFGFSAVFVGRFFAHLPHHIFAERTDKAAERQPVERVIRTAEREQLERTRRHADAKFEDRDPDGFGDEEVPEFVNQHRRNQHQNKGDDCGQRIAIEQKIKHLRYLDLRTKSCSTGEWT